VSVCVIVLCIIILVLPLCNGVLYCKHHKLFCLSVVIIIRWARTWFRSCIWFYVHALISIYIKCQKQLRRESIDLWISSV
jgi:hypothetical protein